MRFEWPPWVVSAPLAHRPYFVVSSFPDSPHNIEQPNHSGSRRAAAHSTLYYTNRLFHWKYIFHSNRKENTLEFGFGFPVKSPLMHLLLGIGVNENPFQILRFDMAFFTGARCFGMNIQVLHWHWSHCWSSRVQWLVTSTWFRTTTTATQKPSIQNHVYRNRTSLIITNTTTGGMSTTSDLQVLSNGNLRIN